MKQFSRSLTNQKCPNVGAGTVLQTALTILKIARKAAKLCGGGGIVSSFGGGYSGTSV